MILISFQENKRSVTVIEANQFQFHNYQIVKWAGGKFGKYLFEAVCAN